MNKILSIVIAMSLALPCLAAQESEFYYQSVMPDGRVIVGDKPVPGAREVRKVPLRQGNVSAPLSTPAEAAAAAAAQKKGPDPDTEIRNARTNLDYAKAALETGREPLPNERIGTAKGASRLTDAYFARVKALENDVAAAQKNLDDAFARRNAAR